MSEFKVNVLEENNVIILETDGYLNNVGGEMISSVCMEHISNGKIKSS